MSGEPLLIRLARWWVTVVGGALIGAGLVLHGQIAVAEYMRGQVQDTFFLWRGIGQVTFIFQDQVTQSALALNEIPASVLAESDRMAWTLTLIGSVIVLCAPLLKARRKPGGKRRRAT